MSAIRISHSPDLARLEAEGFRLWVVQGSAYHLLIGDIPAVNSKGQIVRGTLYAPLDIGPTGKTVNPCSNHQCWWIGEPPCNAQGRILTEMISNNGAEEKGDGIRTNVAFSRKRADKKPYVDYHEKIWTYVRMIWHEAKAIDPTCDPRSKKPMTAVVDAQARAFHYPDMATTRAGIGSATTKLLLDKIAIIGLGGTGSYILDLIAKTPVAEIHLYDGDDFGLHNAFRAPGAPAREELVDAETGEPKLPKKVDWFAGIYGKMHKGVTPHPYNVGAEQLPEFEGFSFVFVAIDDSDARKVILEGLAAMKLPFIDVGMDLDFDGQGELRGMCRVTLSTPDHTEHIEEVVPLCNGPDNDVYRNIQVADMNMLNATLAVNRWKRFLGFYADDIGEHHAQFTTASHALTKDFRK